MDKEKVKEYIGHVGTFVERFAQARLTHLGAGDTVRNELAEDIHVNVMQKDPSPIRYWSVLEADEKQHIAKCILMLKEVKTVLLKKSNANLIEGLDEFIATSTTDLEEAIAGDDTAKLQESLRTPIEKIQTFSQVQTIHASLVEAQAAGDAVELIRLKAELDKISS